jgi:hypothetical protein
MFDMSTRRVVDFEFVSKGDQRHEGNYKGHSNGMEVEGLTRMLPRWKDETRVDVIVTDHDSKMGRVIASSGWKVKHENDANHAKKSLDRYCKSLSKEDKACLYGLGNKSRQWFNKVLHEPVSVAEKKELWNNTYNHYCGDHSHCPDPMHKGYLWPKRDNPRAQEVLRRYIDEGSKMIDRVNPDLGSTQLNESFHATKAKFADKRLNFTVSTEARFAMAVIANSAEPGWHEELRREPGLRPLPAQCTEAIRRQQEARAARNDARRKEEVKKTINQARNERRAGHKKETKRVDGYFS